MIRKTSREEIARIGLRPDEHTVSLKDKGEWYALEQDGEMITFLCIRIQRRELYIGEIFTRPEYRGRGACTRLLRFVVDEIFPGLSINTHALRASRDIFRKCGFQEYAFRHFKYGDQWWMRRPGRMIKMDGGKE